ncbi:zinc metalloproteinase nas-13-like [Pollicipes pollicipes]|uniref:zinc metalloproteinase nas-13-like n=1 Tax=Pollicipes pollicipes TaxID=41117 RepID=UPI001884CE68|nr:zinc metalloproteinase nas-13-like [Pollicipes pollicipes]
MAQPRLHGVEDVEARRQHLTPYQARAPAGCRPGAGRSAVRRPAAAPDRTLVQTDQGCSSDPGSSGCVCSAAAAALPQVRFSEPMLPPGHLQVRPPPGQESPPSDETRFDVGEPLSPPDFTTGAQLPLPPGRPTGDFVHIVRDGGCYSAVGHLGGNQTLSLDNGCFFRGVVLHELLHAAGLWHEQSRPDRDQHVRVHSENVAAGQLVQLQSYERVPKPPETAYDLGSLMHLGRWAFSSGGRATMSALRDPTQALGQRVRLSEADARAVNRLCRDQSEHCGWWARRGECARNPDYMHSSCAKACFTCTGAGCYDLHRDCSRWANLGQCDARATYMRVYCRRACTLCPPEERPAHCRDRIGLCTHWLQAGECGRSPQFMAEHCPLSCGLCSL